MTKEEAMNKLAECQKHRNPEEGHEDADDVLCAFLTEIGYGDIVAEYNKVERWFA